MEKGNPMLDKIWRYSINIGEYGGIVLADTAKEAREKIKKSWKREKNITHLGIWKMDEDDYFDEENPDVFECYGL